MLRLVAFATAAVLTGVGGDATPVAAHSVATSRTLAGPPASVFVSPTGSDQAGCTKAAPCRSLDRAYHWARPGQVVEAAAGTYDSQRLAVDPSKTSSANVVFRPAAGASVRIGSGLNGLQVGANHVTLEGFTIDWWTVSGADVTMRRIDGQSFFISGRDVLVDGGDYGPYEPPCSPGQTYPDRDNPTVDTDAGRIVIRGAAFHDMTNRNCSAAHMDCLQVASVDGLVIEGNTFQRCFSNGLILTGDFGAMNNITIQNNWFGPTLVNNPSLNWNPTRDCPGAVVRYNTFVGSGVRFECSQNRSGQLYGNIVPSLSSFDCGVWRAVQHHNVAERGQAVAACGPGSYVARDGQIDFVDRARGNYHLVRSSEAVGRGSPSGEILVDIDGERRPLRRRADAGADQRESATLVLGSRIGMIRLGMRRSVVESFYGSRRLGAKRVGSHRLRVATYPRPDGRVTVTYDGDVVVGVATTSGIYTAGTGLGVGDEIGKSAWLARVPWNTCSKSRRRTLGAVTVDVRPRGGKAGRTIAEIAMTRRAYAVC